MSAERRQSVDGVPGSQTVLSSDFQCLQKIEEVSNSDTFTNSEPLKPNCRAYVLSCVELAAELMAELAKIGEADKQKAHKICKEFAGNVQAAQELIVSAVEQHHGQRQFEVTNYPSLAKGYVVAEKVKVLQLHLKEMDKWLGTES